jgi:threonine aldolase
MSYWKLSDFWQKITKLLTLLSSFLTIVFMIQPETHIYIWITGTITFLSEAIKVLFDDNDGDGMVDIFQWREKLDKKKNAP